MQAEGGRGNLGESRRQVLVRHGPPGLVAVIVAFAVLALGAILAAYLLTRPGSADPAPAALRSAAADVADTVDRATQETARPAPR